jgi:hypothetical protein
MRPTVTVSRSDTDGRSSMSTATAVPMSPFYCPEPEEITEAKEKTPINATKKGRSATRTDHRTKGGLVFKKTDAGKTPVVGGANSSPTEVPRCFINETHTKSKGIFFWRRVKQIVRSVSV